VADPRTFRVARDTARDGGDGRGGPQRRGSSASAALEVPRARPVCGRAGSLEARRDRRPGRAAGGQCGRGAAGPPSHATRWPTTRSAISSTSAVTTSLPRSIAPLAPRLTGPGRKSPVLPPRPNRSCDQSVSRALSRLRSDKLTMHAVDPARD
jgi:hypothetical protein